MKIGIIIQARIGSKRFPCKVLAKLHGVSVLEHVVRGCLDTGYKVIVATPSTDSVIGREVNEIKAKLFKVKTTRDKSHNLQWCGFGGVESDVLGRYFACAEELELNLIVRITADCPLIQTEIIKECVDKAIATKADYTSNIFPKRTFAKGLDVEVFTFECLEAAYLCNGPVHEQYGITTDERLYNCEHVTPWMQKTDEVSLYLSAANNYCVDYPNDIKRIEKIISEGKKKSFLH